MNKKFKKSESGVALLFALGLLALLIMLCVSFSMESLQSQKMASNNSNRSAAKSLAMSAVNNAAIAVLQYQAQQWQVNAASFNSGNNTPNASQPTLGMPVDFSSVASKTNSSNAAVAYDQLHRLLPMSIPYFLKPGASLTASQNDYYNYYGKGRVVGDPKNQANYSSLANRPEWVYVNDGNGIVGRFAFQVLPPASTTSINLTYFLRGRTLLTTPATGVISELSQLGVDAMIESTADSSRLSDIRTAAAANPTTAVVGTNELFGGAAGSHFYTVTDGKSNMNNARYNQLIRYFNDSGLPADIEVFKVSNGTKEWFYHRFNINDSTLATAPAHSDAITKINRMAGATSPVLAPLDFAALTKANASGEENNSAARWYNLSAAQQHDLFFFGMIADNQGSFGSLLDRRKQIAANFLDYCDSDSVPTSSSSDWSTTLPSYTGNEKTLYINELALALKAESKIVDNKKISVEITPTMIAELIDVYGGISASDYSLSGKIESVTFDVTAKVTQTKKIGGDDAAAVELSKSASGANPAVCSFDAGKGTLQISSFAGSGKYFAGRASSGADVMKMANMLEFALEDGREISQYEVAISNVKVTFSRGLILSFKSDNVDCTLLPEEPVEVSGVDLKLTSSSPVNSVVIGNMSVKDPRQNLNVDMSYAGTTAAENGENWKKSDWIFAPKAISGSGEGGELSMTVTMNGNDVASVTGAVNIGSDPSKPLWNGTDFEPVQSAVADRTCDCENTTDPAAATANTVSTAYIANRPMQSMWELGFIHRGAAWETINLKSSTVTPQNIFNYLTREFTDEAPAFAGTSYRNGDAAILDVVKLTGTAVSYGQLDVNMLRSNYPGYGYSGITDTTVATADPVGSTSQAADRCIFVELLTSMHTHTVPDFTAAGSNDNLAASDATKVADGIFAETSRLNMRGDTAEYFTDNIAFAGSDNDARREELIGKVMPMLKVDPALVTVFHVDVVAQTIKDVGGVNVAKISSNGTLSTPSPTTLGTFDTTTVGSEMVYLDDITGQAKMRATFDCNPFTGKIKLRSIKYID